MASVDELQLCPFPINIHIVFEFFPVIVWSGLEYIDALTGDNIFG